MAIKIEFDASHNVIPPTLVLTTRSGNRLGGLLYHNLVVKQAIRHSMEMSFSINKNDYTEKNRNADLWNLITDFKLVWCKDWNCYFEITVTTNEESTTDKEITAVSLGDSELSQINLYDIQINTEDDIAREDYEPTVLYNPNNPNASLLHRIMEKVPHYTIKDVDGAIKDIQRTFTFDNKSLYDAFQEIAEEMECVFDIICSHGVNGIERNIYVRDLDNYGNDTNILLSTDVLADNINYSVDTGAVKNCFRLEAGDDLMTATVRNCNPNGSGYIWYISDGLKSDMSDELVEKLESYNQFYDYYYNDYNPFNPTTTGLLPADAAKVSSRIPSYAVLRSRYNTLIDKYSEYTSDYQKIDTPMVGYPSIMEAYYNTVDFYYYLNDSLMPNVQMSDTNAQAEANKITFQSLKNTAVQNLSATTSVATVNSAIGAMAKAIVDTRYQIKVLDDECSFTYSEQNPTWNGKIKVTNYSDEEDTATVTLRTIIISGDYAKFIQQKLDTVLANTRTDTIADITDLFKLAESPFKVELKKYSLQRLKAFHDACQGCIDILIQQGVAAESNTQSSMYQQIYLPYYNKLGFIQAEMDVRQGELDLVSGKFDSEGGLLEYGMQTVLEKERDRIQENLDFQAYLGDELWQEFVAYRREDTYSNTNYVSDGLGNDELFNRAMEFIETAKDEIEKSATKQHTINARLKNLLVMKEFASIVDCFEVGNWLRLKVDGRVFKLRLVDYQIDFESLESIDITFSDIVVEGTEGTAKDILNHAASMATSYNTVSRQARKGDKGSRMLDAWVDDGLALTTTKIIDTADNQEVSWDKHGLVCREYNDLTDSYSDTQVKLINKGVYVTNNNWRTAKAGIGNFTFFNPAANNGEGEYQEAYGVIADTLVGNLILGKNVGIYNTMNSITMDEHGFILTTNGTGNDDPQSVFTIRRKTMNNGVKTFKDMFYIDTNGFVTINGGVKIHIDGDNSSSTMVEMVDGKITTHITDELANGGLIESSISQTASEIKSTVAQSTSKYDETGYTISIRDYGQPNSTLYPPSNYNNQLYLDQETGNVWKSSGGAWIRHKNSNNQNVTLPLITSNLASSITQTAEGILTTVSQTYETKTDSNNKKTALESSILQTAANIESTVKATSGWDISSLNYTINLIGTIDRGNDHSTIGDYIAGEHIGEFYLDDLTGHVYESKLESGSTTEYAWWWKANLTRADSSIYSRIDQTANSITSTVSSAVSKYDTSGYTITLYGYGTPADNGYAASSYNGKYYLDQKTGKLYLSNGSAWSNPATLSLITDNLNSQITQTAKEIKSTVSKALHKYDESGYTITLYGYGTPADNGYAASSYNGKYYLNQNNGKLYLSNGSSWSNPATLTLLSDVLDDSISEISQTADQIKMNVSTSVSQYNLSSFSGVISVFGYGAPTASNPSASTYNNQYYLNQSNGQVYKSNGSSWSTYGNPLSVISGSWQSQITANTNAITSKVGSADVHTIIQQTPEDVRIAWNGISNYISFENAAIKIKNSSNNLLMQLNNSGMNLYDSSSTLLSKFDSNGISLYESDGNSGNRLTMRLNRSGANYYYEGAYLGKIGTNTLGDDSNGNSVRGLVFDLDEDGQYMTWAARTNNSTGYIIKLTYFQNDITMDSSTYKQGFRFSDDVYFRQIVDCNNDVKLNGHTLYLNSALSSYIGFNSGGALQIVGTSDKALTLTGYGSKSISIGGSGVSINTDVTVTGTVTSGSDARLKTNIVDSRTDALSLLSDIELKEFDWISDGSHTSVGIIAQQLKEVIPELVHENPETGMLSIKVDRFIPFLVKSIQELYVLCGGKKQKNKNGWTDILSDKDKRAFASSILNNKPQQPVKPPKTKEEIILLNK